MVKPINKCSPFVESWNAAATLGNWHRAAAVLCRTKGAVKRTTCERVPNKKGEWLLDCELAAVKNEGPFTKTGSNFSHPHEMIAKKNSTQLPMANSIIYRTQDWQLQYCWMWMAQLDLEFLTEIIENVNYPWFAYDFAIEQSNEANHNFRGEWKTRQNNSLEKDREKDVNGDWSWSVGLAWHGFHSIGADCEYLLFVPGKT